MTPSPIPAGGPTPVKITKLPDAGREEMLSSAGLDGSPHWSEVRRWGHGPDDAVIASGDTAEEAELQERGFLMDGGWSIATVTEGGGRDGGLTSHRGALRGDEYVDHERLVRLVEAELGFTFDDVHAVYRRGRLTDTQRELRGCIDARLLALSRSGANMALLARVLGFVVSSNGNCKAIDRALARARQVEEVAA